MGLRRRPLARSPSTACSQATSFWRHPVLTCALAVSARAHGVHASSPRARGPPAPVREQLLAHPIERACVCIQFQAYAVPLITIRGPVLHYLLRLSDGGMHDYYGDAADVLALLSKVLTTVCTPAVPGATPEGNLSGQESVEKE